MPKVSLIVPVYNAENFLARCLDSICNQTFKDIEIICVNDGSTDNSLQILNEYSQKDSRIIVIDKKNEGVSAARNDAIRKSTGEYVSFVDADDWLENDAVEVLYEAIKEKQVDVVRANYFKNKSDKEIVEIGDMCELENICMFSKDENFAKQIMCNMYSGKLLCYVWLLLIKRDVLLKTSLFPIGIPYCEDVVFYTELLQNVESIYFLEKPIYHYYDNQTSCTRSRNYYVRNIYSLARAYEKIIEIIENDKFDCDERKNILRNTYSKKITGMLFFMYLTEKKSQKEWALIIEEIMQDHTVLDIIKKADLSGIPTHLSLPFKLISNKKYKTLVNFYKIRKLIRNIKLKFIKEGEK